MQQELKTWYNDVQEMIYETLMRWKDKKMLKDRFTSSKQFEHKINHTNLSVFKLPGDNNAPVSALVKTAITHASHNSMKSYDLYLINISEASLISEDPTISKARE